MDGKKRNLETKIESLLKMFPVVVILGVRQCGKSTIARRLRPSWKYYDLENHADYDLIHEDPALFFEENPNQLIIDEAQNSNRLFQTLRGVIDKRRNEKGRFILTGSASFELMKNVSESLAGRVAVIELAPFKVNEFTGDPLSNFFDVFENKLARSDLESLKKLVLKTNHRTQKQYFLKGGYPEPVLTDNVEFFRQWMQNYFNQYISRDIRSMYPKLDLVRYRRLVSMLSSLSGTIINKADIARSVEASERAIKDYVDVICGTYFWRMLPAFSTPKIKTTQKLAKGHFVDSGIALYLQNIDSMDDLNRAPALGRYYEAFIVEEIIRGIHATNAVNVQFSHLRTKSGGEIDLIIEGSFGLLPIEVAPNTVLRQKNRN